MVRPRSKTTNILYYKYSGSGWKEFVTLTGKTFHIKEDTDDKREHGEVSGWMATITTYFKGLIIQFP
jgi:hypothetical protein